MKTLDTIYHYRGYYHDGGICRIRIYQREGALPVVVATELPNNPNTSITNMSERLAADVLRDHLPHRTGLDQQPFVWIEHYPEDGFPERLSIVTYSSWTPYDRQGRPSLGRPSWTHCDAARIADLIGEPWEPESIRDAFYRQGVR